MRVDLVPLPHRPPSAASDTLQVPSNLAGSARAEPDRMTPVLSASATTDVLSMGSVPLLEDAGLPGFDLMGLEGREHDLLGARDADRLGGGLREVDHATMGVRAAVVDPHHHRLARLLVRDPDLGAERQSLVGGGQVVGVEPLTIGCLLAVKAGAVPGRNTLPQRLGFPSRGSGDPRVHPRTAAARAMLKRLVMGFLLLLLQSTINHCALQGKRRAMTDLHRGYASCADL